MNTSNKDLLDDLFGRLPEEPLPVNFRYNLMAQIREEAVRAQKKKEHYGLLSIVAASVAMIVAAAGILYKYGVMASIVGPKATESTPLFDIPQVNFPDLSDYFFSFYIGMIVLALLVLDYYLRKIFRKHKQKTTPNEL